MKTAVTKGLNADNARYLCVYPEGLCLADAVFDRAFYGSVQGKQVFSIKFCVGSKILERTYRRAKRRDAAKFSAHCRRKYSLAQRGMVNGYSGPPRPLVPRDQLLDCLGSGMRRKEIVAKFGLTDFLFDRNLRHWGLSDTFKRGKKIVPFRSLIENRELLAELDVFVPGVRSAVLAMCERPEAAERFLFKAHLRMQYLASVVRQWGAKASKRCGSRSYSFTRNRGELEVSGVLAAHGIAFVMQVKVGAFYYDFHVPAKRLLIEVDGSIHAGQERQDRLKSVAAVKQGYAVVRVTYTPKGVLNLKPLLDYLGL